MTAIIGRNILSLGLSRIISGVILFFVYVRAITYLGPEEFGKLSLVLAYYVIFILLVDFGISKYVIKTVSEDKNLGSLYLGNYLVAQFFLGLAALVLFYYIPIWLHYEKSVAESMLIVGVGVLLTSMSIPYSAIVQAWQRIGVVAAVNFLNTLINALWLGLAIIFRQNIQFIFLLYGILGLLNIFLYGYFARQHARFDFNIQKTVVKSLFIFGAPFAFISGFEILIQKIDLIIQKHFLPYEQVGLYSGAYRFVDFLTFIPAVVAISLFPFVAEAKNLKTPEVRGMLNHLNRFMIALGIPMGVGATLAADKIILTLFDERFLGSVRPFQILIWSSVLTLIYAVPNVIMLVKRTRQTLWILAVVTVFNAGANWIFIPKYGILASAVITIVSYLLLAILYTFFAKREADFRFGPYFFWPAMFSGIMAVLIYLLRDLHLFAIVPIALVVYFGPLYAVKFIQKEDLQFLKSIFSRT